VPAYSAGLGTEPDREAAAADRAPAPPAPTRGGTLGLLALQQSAGNQAVVRMLARSEAPVADTAAGAPAERVAAMLSGGDPTAIRDVTDEELTAATPQQRAGLIRVLSDLMWTSKAEEEATLRILRHGGDHAAVVESLNALGYRDRVLASVDDPALHAELEALLGAAPAESQDSAVGAALGAGSAEAVLALQDLAAATPAQRLGLLRILLDLSWSNAGEEEKILEILESAGDGLAVLMADVAAAGLKPALFGHVDSAENAARLTALLTPLGDPGLDADLAIFNQNALEAAFDTVVGGVTSAVENFSIPALIMGVLRPVIHPLDTLLGLCVQVLDFVKDPSVDRVLTFLRDVTGTLAFYLGLLAGACWLASGAMAAIGLPPVVVGGLSLAAISASITGVALVVGIFSLVLAGLKLAVDVAEGAGSSTAGEREHEEQEVGEGVTLLGIAALFAGMIAGAKALFQRLRGSATVEEQANPDALKETADEAKKVEGDAKRSADEAKQEPAGGRPLPAPGTTQRRRLSVADIRRMREQGTKVLTFRSHDPDVVANAEITAQHRTNPNLPDDRIHFVEGYEGANYGRYAMIIEFDKVFPLYPNRMSPGEYFHIGTIPASAGYWALVDDVLTALGR
jgi:hypothetical protein